MIKWEWGKMLISGLQSQFQSGYSEITPDAGLPYRRERFSDVGEIVTGSIILNKNDAELFKHWYKNDLKQGSISFLYYDCVQDIERVARFTNDLSFSFTSNRVNIQFNLMFTPQEVELEEILTVNEDCVLIVNDNNYLYQSGVLYL